jgi:hypothetical protein
VIECRAFQPLVCGSLPKKARDEECALATDSPLGGSLELGEQN